MKIEEQVCDANKGLKVPLHSLHGTQTCFCNPAGNRDTLYICLDADNVPTWWFHGDSLPVLCLNNGKVYHYPKTKQVIVVTAHLKWTRKNVFINQQGQVQEAKRAFPPPDEPAAQIETPTAKAVKLITGCSACKYFSPVRSSGEAWIQQKVPRCGHPQMSNNVLPYTYTESGMVKASDEIPDRCPLDRFMSIGGARVAE